MPILLVKPLPLLKLPGSRLMIDGVDRPGRSSVLHPEPPDRDDGLRVLGEIEVGLDRACDIAVEPEDMVVPRERARCRRAVQPLRRQNVQHHRGDRLDTTTAPIRPGYRIVGIERRVRHRRRDVGHHRPQRHVLRAELPDRGVERCYVALVVGAAMPQAPSGRVSPWGLASLWISNVMKAPAPGTLSTLLPMTEGAASGKLWNVPAVG